MTENWPLAKAQDRITQLDAALAELFSAIETKQPLYMLRELADTLKAKLYVKRDVTSELT